MGLGNEGKKLSLQEHIAVDINEFDADLKIDWKHHQNLSIKQLRDWSTKTCSSKLLYHTDDESAVPSQG